MNKKGISLLVTVIAITVMITLISSAAVIGSGAITSANFEEYKSMLNRLSNNVNEYYLKNNELPITNEIVSAESLGNEFVANLKRNGDLSNKLFVVDISKLNDPTVKKGKGSVESKDAFLVSENTHNVYYLKGFRYKSVIYFSE